MQTDKRNDITTAAEPAGVAVPKSPSRRRLLQAGIGASPVVLSVMSRPVLATNTAVDPCRSPSALASFDINAATSRAVVQSCSNSVGPNTLKLAILPGSPSGAYFDAGNLIFLGYTVAVPDAPKPGAARAAGNAPIKAAALTTAKENPTLREVLLYGPSTNAVQILALNIAAARINVAVKATPTSVITDAELQAMWQSAGNATGLGMGGSYPVRGTKGWDAAALNRWLAQTWPGSS